MTALGLLILGVGVVLLWAAVTGEDIIATIADALRGVT